MKLGIMTIAVDFDGTIVEHEYPKIGKPIPFALDVMRKLQQEGHHKFILWTMREGRLLQEAVDYCEKNGVYFYACNKNYPEEEYRDSDSRKLAADIFIDDRNIGGLLNWGVIYNIIKSGSNTIQDFDFTMSNRQTPRKKNWLIRLGEALEKSKGY
jgi:hydroxymethylpyrimidine pyrophosphatase-like HAD family hydrolase